MGTIKISIELNVDKAEDIRKSIIDIFTPPFEYCACACGDPAPANDPAPAKDPAPANDSAEEIKLEDLQNLVRKCVNNGNNRAKIKEELAKLDARSLSTLDKSKYGEMLEFLNSLN